MPIPAAAPLLKPPLPLFESTLLLLEDAVSAPAVGDPEAFEVLTTVDAVAEAECEAFVLFEFVGDVNETEPEVAVVVFDADVAVAVVPLPLLARGVVVKRSAAKLRAPSASRSGCCSHATLPVYTTVVGN